MQRLIHGKVGKSNGILNCSKEEAVPGQYEWGVTDKPATIGNLWLDPNGRNVCSLVAIPDYVEELEETYLKVVKPQMPVRLWLWRIHLQFKVC